MREAEVVIVGAGAAGLACASRLIESGISCQILEARNRVGGRVFTVEQNGLTSPLELGAEFIHGASPVLMKHLQEHQIPFVDMCDNHLYLKGTKLVEFEDFWQSLEKIESKLKPKRKSDRSINEFIETNHQQSSKLALEVFKSYTEGFQGADLNLMGEKALARAELPELPNLNDIESFRPNISYNKVLEAYLKNKTLKQHVHLGCVVKEVLQEKKSLTVVYQNNDAQKSVQCRYLIVTVPIGVLKSRNPLSHIQFHPPLPELEEDLSAIHMGHVQKITFVFRKRFWESLSKKPVAFLHASSEQYFPTWWTQAPVRAPLLTAWQGGLKAYQMQDWSLAKRVSEALGTLSLLTRHPKPWLQTQVVDFYSNNWSSDPFSLGAYSYGGVEKTKTKLHSQKVFAGHVLFAGEGCAPGPDQGTVHGAMNSGIEAAEKIVALKRRTKPKSTSRRGSKNQRIPWGLHLVPNEV